MELKTFKPVRPTIHQIALVNGQVITLSQFMALRDRLAWPSAETTFKILLGAYALGMPADQLKAPLKAGLPPEQQLAVARVAYGTKPTSELIQSVASALQQKTLDPAAVRAALDSAVGTLDVQKNTELLAKIQ